jgi:fucose permease
MVNDKKLPRQFVLLAVLCSGIFVVYASYFNIFGSSATVMMKFYGITESGQGFILTVQSIGMLAGTIFLALWGERYNKIRAITLGAALLGFSVVMIGLSPRFVSIDAGYATLLFLVLLAGVGCTFIDVMVNGVINENFGEAKTTVLPLTHAFFGIGTVCAPLLVTAVVDPETASSFATPYLIVGIVAAVMFFCFAGSDRTITPLTLYADMTEIRKRVAENPAEIFRFKESWIILAASVFYFAYQIGTAVWLPAYCQQVLQMEYQFAGRMLTIFFGGALVMRFLSPLLLKKLPVKQYFIWFTLGSAACMTIALLSGGPAFIPLIAAAGFLQGLNAVLLILMSCAIFPQRTASATAIVPAAVGISTMLFPFIMGAIAESASFVMSFLLIIVCCAASSLIIFFLGKGRSL